jgi:dTMP kinase
MKPGKLIVLEGIDGAGTTTQQRFLDTALSYRGLDVEVTREPTFGPIGNLLRDVMGRRMRAFGAEAMALLFAADRLDHLAREVEPALARGAVVICDRYDLSTLTYQAATHPDGEAIVPWLRAINSRARRPDLTIVVDVAPEVAAERRAARGGPAELFEQTELQARLARLYARAELLSPGDRIVHVNGDRSEQEVAADVLRVALFFCIEGRAEESAAPQCPPEFFVSEDHL